MIRPTRQSAFSLVELSIVLVIIALLVGGIVTGRHILRLGEIRSVVADVEKFRGAYTQFKTQYNGMPGDITDATEYWGTDPDGCPNNTNRTPHKTTCDGNGNNMINASEMFRAWQQLANAGLIEGNFTGVAGAGGATEADMPRNVPAGKIPETGYSLFGLGTTSGNSYYFDGTFRTVLIYGKRKTAAGPTNPALTPAEVLQIEDKMDDRLPASGSIMAMKTTSGVNPNCVTNDDPTTARYNATYNDPACAMITVFETE